MTPDTLLRGVLHARRGGGATAWEACAALLRDLPTEADVLAVAAPGVRLAVGLADALDVDRLFLHLQPGADPWEAATGPAVVLSDHDADASPAVLAWPPRDAAPALRLRRADTLYADSHRVGLVALEASAPTVLAGARRLLADRQPALLLDGGAVPPGERAAWLEEAVAAAGEGYRWHDSLRLPLPDPAARRDAVLLLAESVFVGVAAPAGRDSARPAALPPGLGALPGADPAGLSLAALAWGGWGGAAPTPLARAPLRTAFGPDLACRNFHAAETDGLGGWWRWSGPGTRSVLALPLPARGAVSIRLEVVSWGTARGPEELALFLGGARLPLRRAEAGAAEYGPFTPAGPGRDAGRAVLEMVTPDTHRASERDPRRIGVCLASATLVPEG